MKLSVSLGSAFTLSLCFSMSALSAPSLTITDVAIDENTANGTVVGQAFATSGASTSTLQLDVGKQNISHWSTRSESYESVSFNSAFSAPPIVYSQIQSYGNYTVIYSIDTYSYTGKTSKKGYDILFLPRQQNTSTNGFESILQTDLHMGGSSVVTSIDSVGGSESLGWLAISGAVQGTWSDKPFETVLTDSVVTDADTTVDFTGPFYQTPQMLANLATSNDTSRAGVSIDQLTKSQAKVYVDELGDGNHNAEAVSLMMLQGEGDLEDVNGNVIGETGSVVISDTNRAGTSTVNLLNSYSNPVVFVRPVGISTDVYDATYRFTNIGSNSFTGYLHGEDETNLSAEFGNVTLNYVVLEAGSWTIGVQNYHYVITGGNDSGAFVIDPDTGRITVADSSQLDYESGATQYALTVQVTDGTGQTATSTVTISLNNMPDSLNSDAQEIDGLASNDWTGWAVAGAGDINGDGYDDVIVGAPHDDTNGSDAGRAYVLFGNSSGRLSDLSSVVAGVGGFVINGEAAGNKAGFAVAGGDDVNGDGLDDVIVGAPYTSNNGTNSGSAYVIFGKTNTTPVELASLASDADSSGFAMYGAYAYDRAGGTLVMGDINGDGLADITISEIHRASNTSGLSISTSVKDVNLAYTVFGKTDGTAVNLADIASDTDTGGFVLKSSYRKVDESWKYGAQVLPVGDFNSDGLTDYISNYGLFKGGENLLIYGRVGGTAVDLKNVDNAASYLTINPQEGDYLWNFGYSHELPAFVTSALGDINGDGLDDIALLLTDPSCCDALTRPRAYVVFGTTAKALINLDDIAAGIGGFIVDIDTDAPFDYSGNDLGAIGGAGDLNGDGYDDMVIGDTYTNSGNGSLYVIYGKSDTNTVLLSNIVTGNGGFYTAGNGGDGLGHWIAKVGDINGDGIDDAAFGAPTADPSSGSNAGKVYLMLGKGEKVSQWGTSGDDTLIGTTNAADTLVGGEGHDSLRGNGGADVLYGGPGDDTFTVTDNNFLRIDGGNGTDTVKFEGGGLVVNVATSSQRMRSIEVFDIDGSGANILSINKSVTDTGKVIIKGGTDDTVYSTNQQWTNTLVSEVEDGITYEVYTAGSAIMWLQSGVPLTTNTQPTIENQVFSVDEYTEGGTVLGTISADAEDIGDSVTYSVVAGNDAGYFSVDSATGELSISNTVDRLDYESGANYALTTQVTDLYGAFAQATVTINVKDLSTITSTLSMDASGGGSIWAGSDSLLSVVGGSATANSSNSFDFDSIPGLPISTDLMSLSMTGQLQMDTAVTVSGGTVDASLPVKFSVSYPDEVQPGGRIEIQTSLMFDEEARFTVTSPQFDASVTASLLNYDFNISTNLPNMVSSQLNGYNGEISGTEASKTLSIGTTSDSSTSTQSPSNSLRLEASIDLPNWVDQELSFPSSWKDWTILLFNEKEGCKEDALKPYGGRDLYYNLEYSIVEPTLTAKADLYQDFSVELNPVAVMTLEDGSQYAFDPRSNLIFTPETSQDVNGDGVIDATMTVSLNPVFTNNTQFYTYLTLPFKGAEVHYKVSDAVCTFNFDGSLNNVVFLNGDYGVFHESATVGPLIDQEFSATITDSNGDPDWVDQTFSYSLSNISYTEKLAFDLCNGGGTACAAVLNNPPTASNASIDGTVQQGQTLTGTYSYSDTDGDTESGSSYQWNLASDASGSGSTIISGATSVNYVAADTDSGKYLQFCMTPSDGSDTGSQTCSAWTFVLGELDKSLVAGFDKAMTVDGSQYARIPLNGNFNPAFTSFTLETWFKVDTITSGNQHILQQLDSSGTGRTMLGINNSALVFSYFGGVNLQTTTTIEPGVWYQVAQTFDTATSTSSLYLNGKLEDQRVINMESNNGDIVMGVDKTLNDKFFAGALDETRIWTEARSQSQIQKDMGLSVAANDSTLLVHYTYDNDNGVLAKDATDNYNADLYNTPGYIYSTEHTMSFDGADDYIEIADATDLAFGSGSFSVEAWVYADANSTGDFRNIVCKKLGIGTAAGWVLRLNNNMYPQFFMANGTNKLNITDTNVLPLNTWNHVSVSIDRTTQTGTLYVNGQPVASNSVANVANVDSSATMRFSTWSTNTSNDPWVGNIDDVRIWNTALTQTEVEANMNSRFDTAPSDLMAYYTFENRGENNIATDMSGNGHNGTLAGDTVSSYRGISIATQVDSSVSGVLPGGAGTIMYHLDTAPAQGIVTVDKSTGAFSYSPNGGAIGTDSFTYYVIDANGNYSYSETVDITIE